jgi:hypothetical protein
MDRLRGNFVLEQLHLVSAGSVVKTNRRISLSSVLPKLEEEEVSIISSATSVLWRFYQTCNCAVLLT